MHTGEGQYIDASLFEAAPAYTIWESDEYWATGAAPGRLGTAHRLAAPYQVFATASGWIAIGAANNRNWELLAKALDRSELLQNAGFATNAYRDAEDAHHLRRIVNSYQHYVIYACAFSLCGTQKVHLLDVEGYLKILPNKMR